MDDSDSEWQREGATLSDKTAREEFGLTQDEIILAIRAGTLHYREGSMYGNPWLRLLRREVEALVGKKHGNNYLKDQQAKTELARLNRELRQSEGPDRSIGGAKGKADCRLREMKWPFVIALRGPNRAAFGFCGSL